MWAKRTYREGQKLLIRRALEIIQDLSGTIFYSGYNFNGQTYSGSSNAVIAAKDYLIETTSCSQADLHFSTDGKFLLFKDSLLNFISE